MHDILLNCRYCKVLLLNECINCALKHSRFCVCVFSLHLLSLRLLSLRL